jgi:transcriptional regulator with XRE-family HTH domain
MKRQPRIGQRLAAARLQRGRTQAEVARSAGIAPSYLSRVETGKIQPTFRTLNRIARAMEMHFDELEAFETGGHAHGVRCPISEHGDCMLDMIHAVGESHPQSGEEFYSSRQIKLLRRFAQWMRRVPVDRIYAMEIMLEDLERANLPPR